MWSLTWGLIFIALLLVILLASMYMEIKETQLVCPKCRRKNTLFYHKLDNGRTAYICSHCGCYIHMDDKCETDVFWKIQEEERKKKK